MRLPADDIVRMSLVCKNWSSLLSRQHVWRSLFLRELPAWRVLTSDYRTGASWAQIARMQRSALSASTSMVSCGAEVPAVDWKRFFLQQYGLNCRQFRPDVFAEKLDHWTADVSTFPLPFPFKSKVYRVPMFGWGMETSAKQILYELLWCKNSPFVLTKAYPGVIGIGSGFGFRVNGKEINIAAMYPPAAEATAPQLRPLWQKLFENSNGFVFVVDGNRPLEDAGAELAAVIDERWFQPGAPLLVLYVVSNTQTASSPTLGDIASALRLMQFKTLRWSVRVYNISSIQGVVDGLAWLASCL